MIQVYPSLDIENEESLSEVVDRLQSNAKIRFQVAGGPLTDAVYGERDTSSTYVEQYVWKKQLIGKKKVLRKEYAALAIADLEQLHVNRRIGTTQKVIGMVLGFGLLFGLVWAMVPPPVE